MAADTDRAPTALSRVIRVPPMLTKTTMQILAEKAILPPKIYFPPSTFARALTLENGTKLPQAIAHRGYKAAFPENTMASFKGAVEAGAHALETDIHLTKDDVVVLSHDATLKRCFGRPEKIINCDWEYISPLRTLAEPKEPMPQLKDLLQYLAMPGLEELWVLLDIKLDNNADDVMRLIASTMDSVPPSATKAWKDRVVLGIWATKYLPLCEKYLPGYPISHIGFSTTYAGQFFSLPNISFNMLQVVLHGPFGSSFLRKAKKLDRPVFAWTVNEQNRMRWCIRKNLDGVITDDPKTFLEVCKDYEDKAKVKPKTLRQKEKYRYKDWYDIVRIQILVTVFIVLFRFRFGWGVDQRFASRGASIQEKVIGRSL